MRRMDSTEYLERELQLAKNSLQEAQARIRDLVRQRNEFYEECTRLREKYGNVEAMGESDEPR